MGEVYEAVDTRLHNTVAVKRMTAEVAAAGRAFEREARLLAALRHPALPVVIDHFADAATQFLVMQYIEGEDLAQALERRGRPFDPHELVQCALALAGALLYLHRRDPPIIHRDLKPHNVSRTPAGEYVLLDFGLATGRRDSDSTVALDDRGIDGYTPQYSPPEQIDRLPIDARSDIFSLGATLFHLATAGPPPTARERLRAIAGGAPDPFVKRLQAATGLDPRVHAVIARALALDPGDRFQSAAEVLAALDGSDAATESTPATEVSPSHRRVDAALPSQAELGRAIDLIVQVRFADSLLLGIEDWPSRRRPDQIEQASESLSVIYPTDPDTGARLPARLRIRIIALDFQVVGMSEQLLDVPPRDYSKRLAFLLMPVRAGFCRVNVEVYALDAVFLGMVAIEAEAIDGATVTASGLRVANLDLHLAVEPVTRGPRPIGPDETADGLLIGATTTCLAPGSALQHDADSRQPVAASPRSALPSHLKALLAGVAALVVLIVVGVTMLRPRIATAPSAVVVTETPPPLASATLPEASGRTPSGGPASQALPPSPPAVSAPLARGGTGAVTGATLPPNSLSAQSRPPAQPGQAGQVGLAAAGEVKAPTSDEEYAKGMILAVLKRYCAAYEALDPDAVRSVFPKVNVTALRQQLHKATYKSIECTIAEPTYDALNTAAGTATLHVDIKRVFERTSVGERPEAFENVATISLARGSQRGQWFIESAEYRPKPKQN